MTAEAPVAPNYETKSLWNAKYLTIDVCLAVFDTLSLRNDKQYVGTPS